MIKSIKVSVCMITYNHENFIREAIEGVLMQKTNFLIEFLISEDFSTDCTRKIVKEYAEKHPDIIRVLLPEKNLGMSKNFLETLKACNGKYIALCEGDDYWTDPYKLQKQVDFLETNKEYSICSHRYKIYYDDTKTFEKDINESLFKDGKSGYSFDLKGFFSGWFLHTLTVTFRKESLDLELLSKLESVFDYILFYSLMKNGKGYLFGFEGGVYRKHAGGICTSNSAINHSLIHYKAFKDLYKIEKTNILGGIVKYHLFHHIKTYLKYSNEISYKYLYNKTKEYFSYKIKKFSVYDFSKMVIKSILYRLIKR